MTTFVKTINFGQKKLDTGTGRKQKDKSEQKDIHIALPSGSDFSRHALTIIAGRNRTGKSHLLRNAEAALNSHNLCLGTSDYVEELGAASSNVWIRPQNPALPFAKWLLISDIQSLVAKFSTFGTYTNLSRKAPFDREVITVKDEFLKRQFATSQAIHAVAGKLTESEIEAIWVDENKRWALFNKLDESKIYKAEAEACSALRAFESLTSAKVYLRLNSRFKGIDLILRHGASDAFAFGGPGGGWSQGQKVACVIFLMIEYAQPKILLVDELENHLHPEYITKVCEFIKNNVQQTIIVTHHPHLIFSSYVDRAWYIEVLAEAADIPLIEDFPDKKTIHRPPPKRRIIELKGDFERIAAIYNLFDSHDLQLLNLASASQEQMTREMLLTIESGLTLEVAGVSASSRADTQSRELHDVIRSILNSRSDQSLKILDFGAGRGRTFLEMQKTRLFHDFNIEWVFYEPNVKVVNELLQQVEQAGDTTKVIVTSSLSSLEHNSFDAILAVNLLHECSPLQISEILQNCRGLLKSGSKLIVAELYPLLSPERFGIAYAPSNMVSILRTCGYLGFTVPIPIRSGLFSAYTCIASPQEFESNNSEVANAIRRGVWAEILSQTVTEYTASMELGTSRNAIKLASQLHVIASIAAYDAELWT